MEPREDRWFVRFRGHTLGPLTSEQVRSSLRKKELGPEDKLASARDPSWRPLRAVPEFFGYWEKLSPVSADLNPLPSPQYLWRKKLAPLPVVPEKKAEPLVVENSFAPKDSAPPAKKEKTKTETKAATKVGTKAKKKSPIKVKSRARPKKKPSEMIAAQVPVEVVAPETLALPVILLDAPVAETTPIFLEAEAAQKPLPVILSVEPPAEPITNTSDTKLAKETLSLLETLREWSQKEQELTKFSIDDFIPPKPAMPETVTYSWAPPASSSAPKIKNEKIELHLTLSKKFIFALSLVAALCLAAIVMVVVEGKKMRGLDDSRLPDPSSPTIEPAKKNDPIPSLQAPTRPKRD